MEIIYEQQVGFIHGSARSVVRYLGRLKMHDLKTTDKVAKNNGVWKMTDSKRHSVLTFL